MRACVHQPASQLTAACTPAAAPWRLLLRARACSGRHPPPQNLRLPPPHPPALRGSGRIVIDRQGMRCSGCTAAAARFRVPPPSRCPAPRNVRKRLAGRQERWAAEQPSGVLSSSCKPQHLDQYLPADMCSHHHPRLPPHRFRPPPLRPPRRLPSRHARASTQGQRL